MKIQSVRLIKVELTHPIKIFTDTGRKYGKWEVEPEFTIWLEKDNKYNQDISVEIIRTINEQHAKIVVLTSFELELASNDYVPTTDQDFIEYASFQQIAIAHARTFFLKETEGTIFSGGLIPIDNLFHALQKVKVMVFNTDRLN